MRVLGILEYDNDGFVSAVVEQPDGVTDEEAYIHYVRNVRKGALNKTDQQILDDSTDNYESLTVIPYPPSLIKKG